ncbi:hypothetical protein PoB_002578100 [Plakobranchus ocellatus]|uniref:Uncharacterized protein n=1 Tax=Plakobranchus ocellatus TaxID=259542 RepID=A0AAV3ZJJ3_9GAST|nr:hypothetical protein PoB_002578100 [Plakobranchus ocellatus]
MASTTALISLLLAALCVSTSLAQFGPLAFAALGGDFDGSGGGYLLYNQLNRRIAALEFNVRSGAIGGCESGVIGPLSAAQNTATLTFRGQYLAPPAVSLALSDVVTVNPALPINYQIRPTQIDRQKAEITFTDATTNVASLFVSYMVCPSNSAYAANGVQG